MSETQFTPGEWEAIPSPIDSARWMVMSRDGATFRRIAIFEPSHYVTDAECEANAKALAASKEMYAALDDAHAFVKHALEFFDWYKWPNVHEAVIALDATLSAAFAKANPRAASPDSAR